MLYPRNVLTYRISYSSPTRNEEEAMLETSVEDTRSQLRSR